MASWSVFLGHELRNPLGALMSAARLLEADPPTSAAGVRARGVVTRLEQVVANLVGNALKFTPPGGTVSVTVGPENGQAVLVVSDTGIGVRVEALPRIFDLFVQGEHGLDRPEGGLGIGLTLVRRLAELHGGAVEASSGGPGKGSAFTVRLPAVVAPVRADWPVLARASR